MQTETIAFICWQGLSSEIRWSYEIKSLLERVGFFTNKIIELSSRALATGGPHNAIFVVWGHHLLQQFHINYAKWRISSILGTVRIGRVAFHVPSFARRNFGCRLPLRLTESLLLNRRVLDEYRDVVVRVRMETCGLARRQLHIEDTHILILKYATMIDLALDRNRV